MTAKTRRSGLLLAGAILLMTGTGKARNWVTEYNGYGTVTITPQDSVELSPKAPVTENETHSALVLSQETKKRPLKDFEVSLSLNVQEQLRKSSPKPWEVFWLFFNYRKTADGKKSNYLLLKPNGTEIGRAYGETGQTFLYTGPSPVLPAFGKTFHLTLIKQGQELSLLIDGKPALRINESDHPPGLYDEPGAIGLYAEDAKVKIDSVRIQSLDAG